MTIPDPGFSPLEVVGEVVSTLGLMVPAMVATHVAFIVFGVVWRFAARSVRG